MARSSSARLRSARASVAAPARTQLRPHPVLLDRIDQAEAALAVGATMQALDLTNAALALAPANARAHCLLGRVALALGQPQVALAPLERAHLLEATPAHRFWHTLCRGRLASGDEAARLLAVAASAAPPTVPARLSLGTAHEALGDPEQALRFYDAALAIDPGHVPTRSARGRLLSRTGSAWRAALDFEAAAAGDPVDLLHRVDLAVALSQAGQFDEACRVVDAVIAVRPDIAVAHDTRGHALLNLNRSIEAIPAFRAAIALQPELTAPRFGLALAMLKSGDLAPGWREYEWRWHTTLRPRTDLVVPCWQGEPLHGRTILIHGEQGLGDMLQFARFVPLVAQRGGRVVLQVPQPLVRLLRGVEGVAEVITGGVRLPPIDLHCPLGSLPHALSIRLDSIPARPYLAAPADTPAREPDPSAPGPLVVGLVWAGDPRPGNVAASQIDARRSMQPVMLAPLLDVPDVRFVSFQFGATAAQRAATGMPLDDALHDVTDFAGTAARLAGIDLLISVDTSIVHLAGGMGLPVWTLSRFDGCWRWLEDRSDSPWYPSMRIFRQPRLGDWSGLVAEVHDALREFVTTRMATVIV